LLWKDLHEWLRLERQRVFDGGATAKGVVQSAKLNMGTTPGCTCATCSRAFPNTNSRIEELL
jgi:hypothetical protein